MDDARLVERMRRGDPDVFAALFAAHHPPIYRYAARMCGAAAADDVVQETSDVPSGQSDRVFIGPARCSRRSSHAM